VNLLEVLAVHRLTKLVTEDQISEPYREKIVLWSEKGSEGSLQDRIGYLVECRACVSVWASAAIIGLRYLGRPGKLVIGVLAGSAASLAVAAAMDKLEAESK
jgi:hypothetical protein